MTRLERLRDMIDRFGVDLDETTAGEDLAPYLEDGTPVERFALVSTHGNDYVYIWLADEREACEGRAQELVADSIHSEQPIEIVDMDSGERWLPLVTVAWTSASARI